jgi:hypothetical protein
MGQLGQSGHAGQQAQSLQRERGDSPCRRTHVLSAARRCHCPLGHDQTVVIDSGKPSEVFASNGERTRTAQLKASAPPRTGLQVWPIGDLAARQMKGVMRSAVVLRSAWALRWKTHTELPQTE